ncbi:MAG: matrixin family metalloprotease [Bryobacterales bacterium]|nr:matrixin family metalloprotease [Bryobacterales bacterium]
MGGGKTLLRLATAMAVLAGTVFGHYHFLHYRSATGPFAPVPERFDLRSLPNRTVQFFVSSRGPEQMAPGDSLASLLSQLRLAAQTWSQVPTSELRLAFGGFSEPGTPHNHPRIEVVFDELPPGLVALGGPTVRAEMTGEGEGAFVPILRSVVVLPKDLSSRPSHSDAFFLTMVHEMGHALGLQHTQSSSVMSTYITRATTRAKPLAEDDIAGISSLYPNAEFALRFGAIRGRVTMNGVGVHLASVMALSPGGASVAALTDPDGYYHIAGIPPGRYYLYVHPLPPALQPELGPDDIVLPTGPDGRRFPPGPLFQAQFYPGTGDLLRAAVIDVTAGGTREGLDFQVVPRGPLTLYGVSTYSFPGNVAVKPAFLNLNGPRNFLVASGQGLTVRGSVAPGLQASVMGGSAFVLPDGIRPYPPAPDFLQVSFQFTPFSGIGPRHLIFTRDSELYVLPAGLNVVASPPPSIRTVSPLVLDRGRTAVSLAGSGFTEQTRILFDGLPATILAFDKDAGTILVQPPQGAPGHRAIVTALNPDGQTSLFLDAPSPPVYTYAPADPPSISITPASLPSGSVAMVEIQGENTNFSQGQTLLGFGSTDVVARRTWVLSPNRLWANVWISPSARPGSVSPTAVTGFEIARQVNGFQIEPARVGVPVPDPSPANPATGLPSIYSGGQALLRVSGFPANLRPEDLSLSLNEQAARVLRVSEEGILFEVPGGLPVGPTVARLRIGGILLPPFVVPIDLPPPVIVAVTKPDGVPVTTAEPAVPGQAIILAVFTLAAPGSTVSPDAVTVSVAGVPHRPTSVRLATTDPSVHFVEIVLSGDIKPGDSVPVTVRIEDRLSPPFLIPIRSP